MRRLLSRGKWLLAATSVLFGMGIKGFAAEGGLLTLSANTPVNQDFLDQVQWDKSYGALCSAYTYKSGAKFFVLWVDPLELCWDKQVPAAQALILETVRTKVPNCSAGGSICYNDWLREPKSRYYVGRYLANIASPWLVELCTGAWTRTCEFNFNAVGKRVGISLAKAHVSTAPSSLLDAASALDAVEQNAIDLESADLDAADAAAEVANIAVGSLAGVRSSNLVWTVLALDVETRKVLVSTKFQGHEQRHWVSEANIFPLSAPSAEEFPREAGQSVCVIVRGNKISWELSAIAAALPGKTGAYVFLQHLVGKNQYVYNVQPRSAVLATTACPALPSDTSASNPGNPANPGTQPPAGGGGVGAAPQVPPPPQPQLD